VYCLKGKAEKLVSDIEKRTVRLAQLHGDEPRESLLSLSPCARKSLWLVLFIRHCRTAGTGHHSRYTGRNKLFLDIPSCKRLSPKKK